MTEGFGFTKTYNYGRTFTYNISHTDSVHFTLLT